VSCGRSFFSETVSLPIDWASQLGFRISLPIDWVSQLGFRFGDGFVRFGGVGGGFVRFGDGFENGFVRFGDGSVRFGGVGDGFVSK
jgi:hypothetical protein